jgi:hypothetical protein
MSPDTGSVPAMASRAARLNGPARRAHWAVLAAFVATGQPPSRGQPDRLICAESDDPDPVRAELAPAGLLAQAPTCAAACSQAGRSSGCAGTGPSAAVAQAGSWLQIADRHLADAAQERDAGGV